MLIERSIAWFPLEPCVFHHSRCFVLCYVERRPQILEFVRLYAYLASTHHDIDVSVIPALPASHPRAAAHVAESGGPVEGPAGMRRTEKPC